MIFSNKELIFFSTLPITIWGIIFCIGLVITSLIKSDYVRLTIYFRDDSNLIMICFLYGLIVLTVNRIFEVYGCRNIKNN